MGQQSLLELTRGTYFHKAEQEMMKQADLWFLENRFNIESNYDKDKKMHAYMIYETLDTCECELSNWIHLKLLGMLENNRFNKKTKKLTPIKFTAVNIINQTFQEGLDDWQGLSW